MRFRETIINSILALAVIVPATLAAALMLGWSPVYGTSHRSEPPIAHILDYLDSTHKLQTAKRLCEFVTDTAPWYANDRDAGISRARLMQQWEDPRDAMMARWFPQTVSRWEIALFDLRERSTAIIYNCPECNASVVQIDVRNACLARIDYIASQL